MRSRRPWRWIGVLSVLAGCARAAAPWHVAAVPTDIGHGPAVVVVAPFAHTPARWVSEVLKGYRLVHVSVPDPDAGRTVRQAVTGPVILLVTAGAQASAVAVAEALADCVVGLILLGGTVSDLDPTLARLARTYGWPVRPLSATWESVPWRFWWQDLSPPFTPPFMVMVVAGAEDHHPRPH